MTWPTHALFGISSLWLLAPFPPEVLGYDFGTLAAFAVLGALLPDLDANESKIKHLKLIGTNIKPFLPVARFVSRTEVHRGLLHSIIGLDIVTFMVLPFMFWIGGAPVIALLLGYASHLLADSATKSGIRLYYPQAKRFYLLPKPWRITTGSGAEYLLAAFVLPFALFLLFAHLRVI